MSNRRAIYAARFLRPPGWTKRLLLREKPRELTGPYENPVRRWVRIREKARQFNELPPPRKVPIPKPSRKTGLQAVGGVPRVSPEVLQRRLEFLLSPDAVKMQLAEPLRPGLTPYLVEVACWERQMREVRRIYRAQYLQKLAEVTEIERANEAELHKRALEERRKRKQAHLHRVGEDMKRRAILKDRRRIESKVTEAMEMARRSKIKRAKLYWLRRMDNLSKMIVSAENFEDAFGATKEAAVSEAHKDSASGVLVNRNVSVPFLLRQLGGAKGFPQQKSRRIPMVDNVYRDMFEASYDLLPEDEPRFEPAPAGASARERAVQLYGGFSEAEKMALLDQKLGMLKEKQKLMEAKSATDPILTRLIDELASVQLAAREAARQDEMKADARAERGTDPVGMTKRSSPKGIE